MRSSAPVIFGVVRTGRRKMVARYRRSERSTLYRAISL